MNLVPYEGVWKTVGCGDSPTPNVTWKKTKTSKRNAKRRRSNDEAESV